MEIRKRSGEKVDDYFERLKVAGVELGDAHQGVTKAEVDLALDTLGIHHGDIKDAVWCLLDDDFPSLFARATEFRISDGASTAHIGGYIGILLRGGKRLDREGRDYWIKPLRETGAIEAVTFNSEAGQFVPGHIRAKSPNSAYRLESSFVELLKTASSPEFEKRCLEWVSEDRKRSRLAILVEKQRSAQLEAGASKHEMLIRQSVSLYARHFLPGYEVLFTDFSDGDRVSMEEQVRLRQAGISIRLDDPWPDVILYNAKFGSLWFIEAVTTDGEVDSYEWQGLKAICDRSGRSLGGATTAYADWRKLASRQQTVRNLAAGSRLWVLEDPSKEFIVTGPAGF